MSTTLRLAGLGDAAPGLTAGAAGPALQISAVHQPLPHQEPKAPRQEAPQQPQAEQRASQRDQERQQKQPQDLFGLLLEAAGQPAAAAVGLTAELAASYAALLPQLPLDEKKEKVHICMHVPGGRWLCSFNGILLERCKMLVMMVTCPSNLHYWLPIGGFPAPAARGPALWRRCHPDPAGATGWRPAATSRCCLVGTPAVYWHAASICGCKV
jgi:hypothetical protein